MINFQYYEQRKKGVIGDLLSDKKSSNDKIIF